MMIVERAGAQTPAVEKALVYRTPSAARRSRWGVTANRSPKQPRLGLMSSQVIQRMLGRRGVFSSAPDAPVQAAPASTAKTNVPTRVFPFIVRTPFGREGRRED